MVLLVNGVNYDKKSIKDLILILICANNGKYTWYQLQRELEWRGISEKVIVSNIADSLSEDALIEQKTVEGQSTGLPVYFVTDKGKEKAKEIVEKYGLDCFRIDNFNPNDF